MPCTTSPETHFDPILNPPDSAEARSLGVEARIGLRAAAHYGVCPKEWARRARQRFDGV